MKILLLGVNGQLGHELGTLLSVRHEITAPNSASLDLARPAGIRRTVRTARPDLIINAAAYTAVDRAEQESGLAMAVNAEAPAILAGEAARIDAGLIHFSTDYVFDGTKAEPYTEEDTPCPISVYGKSKLAGESAIQETGVPHLIIRTSWVYGNRGRNFYLTMQRLLLSRDEVSVVGDQFGSPSWCRSIAIACNQILDAGGEDTPGYLRDHSGIYHMTCGGSTNWFGFAQAIHNRMQEHHERLARLREINTCDYPTAAARPAYSVLDNKRLRATFGMTLPHWEQALDTLMHEHVMA